MKTYFLNFYIVFFSRWMDGSFMNLEAEAIEGEVDEYWRDLYKIQKIFNNKMKKLTVREILVNSIFVTLRSPLFSIWE